MKTVIKNVSFKFTKEEIEAIKNLNSKLLEYYSDIKELVDDDKELDDEADTFFCDLDQATDLLDNLCYYMNNNLE